MELEQAIDLANRRMLALGYKHGDTYFSMRDPAFFFAACAEAEVDTSDRYFTAQEVEKVAKHFADDQAHIDELHRLGAKYTAESNAKKISRDPLVLEAIGDLATRTFLDNNGNRDPWGVIPRNVRASLVYKAADLGILIVKEYGPDVDLVNARAFVWPPADAVRLCEVLTQSMQDEHDAVQEVKDAERLGLLKQIARNQGKPEPTSIPPRETRTASQLLAVAREARRARVARIEAENEARRRRNREMMRQQAAALAREEAQKEARRREREAKDRANEDALAVQYAEMLVAHLDGLARRSRDLAGDTRRLLSAARAAGGPQAACVDIWLRDYAEKFADKYGLTVGDFSNG